MATAELKLTKKHARKVLSLVDCGLTRGAGTAEPGKMCVEAVISYARQFKIYLNDSDWSSDAARAKGMRRVAVAQLGSNTINQQQFAVALSCLIIKRIVPAALRAAAKVHPDKEHAGKLEAAAKVCQDEGTESAASAAESAARSAARSARDELLAIAAECAVEALQECGSPGCKWLSICEE